VFVAFDGNSRYDTGDQERADGSGRDATALSDGRARCRIHDVSLSGKAPPKSIEVPVLVVTSDNVDGMLPEIKKNVFGEDS